MSNPLIPPLPLPDDDRLTSESNTEPGIDEPGIMDQDGERVLDPDIDDGLVDSASADRLAAETESADQRESTVPEVPAGRAGADSGAVDAVRIDPDDEAGLPDASPMNDEPGVGPARPRS